VGSGGFPPVRSPKRRLFECVFWLRKDARTGRIVPVFDRPAIQNKEVRILGPARSFWSTGFLMGGGVHLTTLWSVRATP